MALTRKQQVFVSEYLQCWNESEAARRAGYSERSAGAIGCENLKKPEIAAEIARRVASKALKAEECLLLLADQARGSLADFLKIDRNTVKLDLAAAQAAGKLHLIESFKETRAGYEIKLYSAQDALEKLGKALGVLTERIALQATSVIAELPQVDDDMEAASGTADSLPPQ